MARLKNTVLFYIYVTLGTLITIHLLPDLIDRQEKEIQVWACQNNSIQISCLKPLTHKPLNSFLQDLILERERRIRNIWEKFSVKPMVDTVNHFYWKFVLLSVAVTKNTTQVIWQKCTNSGDSALEPPDTTTTFLPSDLPTLKCNHSSDTFYPK